MQTTLPANIETMEQATKFLTELFRNGETFHPEDNAHDVDFQTFSPTFEEREQLNRLMEQCYQLPDFDPCRVIMDLYSFTPEQIFAKCQLLTLGEVNEACERAAVHPALSAAELSIHELPTGHFLLYGWTGIIITDGLSWSSLDEQDNVKPITQDEAHDTLVEFAEIFEQI